MSIPIVHWVMRFSLRSSVNAAALTPRLLGLLRDYAVEQIFECRFIQFNVRAIGLHGLDGRK
jgi:hypothetical protein